MLALCLAAIMSLPIYPLNPTKVDTLNTMNLHITAGINGPSKALSTGPELTAKYEYLLYHPIVLRSSLDYRFGDINSTVLPNGSIHRITTSVEAIFYRGTNRMTGYFGLGIIYSINRFNIDDESYRELNETLGITRVEISRAFGYRLTAGLRMNRTYSLEIGITEVSPSFVYITDHSANSYTIYKESFRFNDFKISLGYIFTLKI